MASSRFCRPARCGGLALLGLWLASVAASAQAPSRSAPAAQSHAAGVQMPAHNRHFLTNVEWLAGHRDSAVVIHVGRSDSAYRAAHVPGARFLPLSAVAITVDGIPNEFPPLADLTASFQNLGIPEGARIVLYGDDPGLYAARTWAAFDAIGHAGRAALLDGGLGAWRAAGQPVEEGAAPSVRAQPLDMVRPRESRIVDAEWVRTHLNDTTVLFVDARPAANFEGREDCPPGRAGCLPEGRRGHIPGAVSLFWMQALTDGEVRLTRSLHELHHELWQPAGADRPRVRTIVVYCTSGMQASHGYWQARYLGYPDVRLYDGSMSEWSSLAAASHPVAAGR